MARKAEFWGMLGTILYFVIIATTVAFKFDSFIKLELNELGDFLAGVFGPVAFLWLVLGYLQQGRELKLSTDALNLQAMELRNSVEQQAEMARIQNVTLENQHRLLQPLFEIRYKERYHYQGEFFDSFEIENSGGYCDCVNVSLAGRDGSKFQLDLEPLNKGTVRIFSFDAIEGQHEIQVRYRALNDFEGLRIFDLQKWYGDDEGEEGFSAKQRPQ